MHEENEDKQLPVPVEQHQHGGDGFDDSDERAGGYGPLEKFVDGDWTLGGVPADPKRRLVAVHTQSFVRRWQGKRVVHTITEKPLPDLEQLNATIPTDEWELDLNGAPRKPYELAHRLDLLDLDSGEHTCFIGATVGAAIAVSRLKDKVAWMRRLRGPNVVPQVTLSSAPFKTQFGMRKRPDFRVAAWFDLSGGAPAALRAQAPQAVAAGGAGAGERAEHRRRFERQPSFLRIHPRREAPHWRGFLVRSARRLPMCAQSLTWDEEFQLEREVAYADYCRDLAAGRL